MSLAKADSAGKCTRKRQSAEPERLRKDDGRVLGHVSSPPTERRARGRRKRAGNPMQTVEDQRYVYGISVEMRAVDAMNP